ncbi:MAG TPA: phosphoglycerate kinase [archaeon]|nr:phosphoglycerate kinase [archaeon]
MFDNSIVFDKVDVNVPIDPATGKIIDIQKILETEKSVRWCFANGAYSVVVLSHQGRKKDESLEKHAQVLGERFPVTLFAARTGSEAVKKIAGAKKGSVIVLENLRSDDEEKDYGDATQTKLYGMLKEVEQKSGKKVAFVKDDFSVCHRKDLCVYGLPRQLKKEGYKVVAGPVMQEELEKAKVASQKMKERKVIGIWGGKKLEDYINVFKALLEKRKDAIVLTSGPLSILMQSAMGLDVGENAKAFKITPELTEKAKSIVEKFNKQVVMPLDYYSATGKGRELVSANDLRGVIVDLGPRTVEAYKKVLRENPRSAIIGNGPLGEYEKEENRVGTWEVYAEAFNPANNHFVMGGGGDFNAVMHMLGLQPHVSSTGGKAFLECVVNGGMPGLEVIEW